MNDHNRDKNESTPSPSGGESKLGDLQSQLAQMRVEADRISALETGDEQVEAAERFAEDIGRLDERVGAAARDADDASRNI